MITIHINYIPSKISDHWLADPDDLAAELRKIMPDVKSYSSRGFKTYKWYKIEDIFRCYNSELPVDAAGLTIIEFNIIPKNI